MPTERQHLAPPASQTQAELSDPPRCCATLQVYLARWHETPVAVKVLIDKDAMANAGPKEALSLPDSLLAKLDEVGKGGARWQRWPCRGVQRLPGAR